MALDDRLELLADRLAEEFNGVRSSLSEKVGTSGNAAPGAVFWGVFAEGDEPTPPDDGKIHWGIRIPA